MAEFEDSQGDCARHWKRINVHGIDINMCLADCARHLQRDRKRIVHDIEINMCLADILCKTFEKRFMHGIGINMCVANCARL
jgi:hypothetical protein